MANFWGKLFTINFVMGIITGITMEFQFGTNWSEYSKYMGDIFGSPLAIEALVAFFLESTFMGIWLFGKDKISPKFRAFCMWMVALGTNISALWIITANGFMQNPVGYVVRNGRAELNDFWALVTNPYAWNMFFHTVVGCYIVGAFFVMAISAYHLLRKNEVEFFKKSFKFGLMLGLFAATITPFMGHQSGVSAAKYQPAKGCDGSSLGNRKRTRLLNSSNSDVKNEKNFEFLTIPKLGSFFYTNSFDGEIVGLKDIPKDERPNVNLVYYSFRLMVALGMFFMALTWYGFYLKPKRKTRKLKTLFKNYNMVCLTSLYCD